MSSHIGKIEYAVYCVSYRYEPEGDLHKVYFNDSNEYYDFLDQLSCEPLDYLNVTVM